MRHLALLMLLAGSIFTAGCGAAKDEADLARRTDRTDDSRPDDSGEPPDDPSTGEGTMETGGDAGGTLAPDATGGEAGTTSGEDPVQPSTATGPGSSDATTLPKSTENGGTPDGPQLNPPLLPDVGSRTIPRTVPHIEPLPFAGDDLEQPVGPSRVTPNAHVTMPESSDTLQPRVATETGEAPPGEKVAGSGGEPPEAMALTVDEQASDEDHTVVKVFYGTDRNQMGRAAGDLASLAAHFRWTGIAAVVTLTCGGLCLVWRRKTLSVLAILGLCATATLAYPAVRGALADHRAADKEGVQYGNERGRLERGICKVSIPKGHRIGELEAPSILRLEINEDERKHVVLRSIVPQEEQKFFAELHDCVERSPRKELLLFIHGYNVKFEDAARRTAQMAYDLEFQGAPVFYSWPSQGGLLKYSVDETNVMWTVPHLKQFLLEVSARSGAEQVNLIAHSMGNRALTSALREIESELRENAQLFNQVVLAAPDIDAEVFRRDIAPAIARTARHVTLYASSNDQALIASKQVHGYPRAGESGAHVVVVPEIETVDVSAIDTSLLGHSYYGNNDSILADMYHLIHRGLPARLRKSLKPAQRESLTYWIFQSRAEATARATEPGVESR